MARSKWISFGAQQSLERAGKTATAGTAATPASIPVPSPADTKKFGLENFGNTCYANSVLQALYFCTPFRDLLLQDVEIKPLPNGSPVIPPTPTKPLAPARRKSERKVSTTTQNGEQTATPAPNPAIPIPSSPPTLYSALRSLYLHISTSPGDKGTVAPRAFIDKLKELNELFRSTMHQDAHEFLNYLWNQIVEEIEEERRATANGVNGEDLSSSVQTLGSKPPATVVTTTNSSTSGAPPHDATLVHKLFEGVLTSETRCLTCETVSSRDESFLDLSIDIEQNSSVTACLRQFSASEMLCQKNKFFCDSCCDLQEAEKRMKIKKLPNVLALHLKRFKYQEDLGRYIKLAYRVAFPFELRLFNTVDEMDDADRLYNLFAIVVHIGNGPHHGHYISIIKNAGSWFVFDDENVSAVSESDVPKYFGDSNSGSAYVLYYQAVDIDLPSLGLRPREPEMPPEISTDSSPAFDPSPVLLGHDAPAIPPGLDTVTSSEVEHDPLLSLYSEPSPIHPSLPPNPPLPASPPTLSIPQLPDPPSNHSPVTPSTLGRSIMNTIRRAPSMSATRSSASSVGNGPDHRKSTADKSPRPSTSVPSFATSSMELTHEPPPPVPPLPSNILTNSTPTTPISTPYVNGLEKQRKEPEKEKENEKEKSKSGGWFSRKRKSLKIGDKSTSKHGTTSAPNIPPSPFLREEHDAEYSAGRFTRSTSSTGTPKLQRRPSENADALPAEFVGLHPDTIRRGSANPDRRLNGYDGSAPPSGSSSPSSTSLLMSVQTVEGSTTRPSTSVSSTTSSTRELPPVRKPSLKPSVSASERVRSSIDRKRSLDIKAMVLPGQSISASPLSSTHALLGYEDLSSLPHSANHSLSYRSTPSNGHFNPADLEPVTLSKGKSRSAENEALFSTSAGPPPPPSSYATRALTSTSLAASVGTNNSTGSSTYSVGSTAKRATRKLSLTSPILGFGRRDKDREKEKR